MTIGPGKNVRTATCTCVPKGSPSSAEDCFMLCGRPQYFKLVDKCVTQIVLQKSGLDPDFHYTKKIYLDVDMLIGELNETILS